VTDIAVPEDLEPLIYTVNGLDDLRDNPNVRIKPMFRSGDNKNYLVPGDMVTIYDINPLYGKGIDGTGQKITVVGQSEVKISDVRTYRRSSACLQMTRPRYSFRDIRIPALPAIRGKEPLPWRSPERPLQMRLFCTSTRLPSSMPNSTPWTRISRQY
jgi:hypothetical protein